MNISKVLAEQSANAQLTDNVKLEPDAVSKLNYEVMYKMLMWDQGSPDLDMLPIIAVILTSLSIDQEFPEYPGLSFFSVLFPLLSSK